MTRASSTDDVNLTLIIETFEVLGYPLLHLVNITLETGTFLEYLKCSIINLIPQIASSVTPEEYRPINMDDKILKKIVYDQLIRYIQDVNKLSKYQS